MSIFKALAQIKNDPAFGLPFYSWTLDFHELYPLPGSWAAFKQAIGWLRK